ncbi:spore germination protein [Ammoniphilus sp. CFH 90114]|uniref:spore germination protein n=1 Tax=Ammoniphilus sp. CFH 90114 TaxID=2493665 RepID=UPI00100F9223|nr:spore germination protein [Ammoniphilus sp. CFH 90114]RXT07992.1 spore germination protein [Ammoniphilus sp. CFH 90114]
MPFVINIFNMKTNSVAQNGNIDIGGVVHNSHTANSKYIGANLSFGDVSPSNSLMTTSNVDTDVSDQDQISNPSLPITNQL